MRRSFSMLPPAANNNAPTTTQIAFGDQPIIREIAGVNAAVLPANYTGGTITITQGFEADVAPRPNGNNGVLTVTLPKQEQAKPRKINVSVN